MRIYSRGTLRDFWEKHPDSEQQLRTWYKTFNQTEFQNPNEIKVILGSADLIGNGNIIFNICGNHYRLIAQFNYEKHLVFLLFIGTHREYDNLDINNL
jgi:mRNA interferase HigB